MVLRLFFCALNPVPLHCLFFFVLRRLVDGNYSSSNYVG